MGKLAVSRFLTALVPALAAVAGCAFSSREAPPVELSARPLPAARVGQPFEYTIELEGDRRGDEWSLEGAPAWLSLTDETPSSVTLRGTPDRAGHPAIGRR